MESQDGDAGDGEGVPPVTEPTPTVPLRCRIFGHKYVEAYSIGRRVELCSRCRRIKPGSKRP